MSFQDSLVDLEALDLEETLEHLALLVLVDLLDWLVAKDSQVSYD